jgi:hypothetical protein
MGGFFFPTGLAEDVGTSHGACTLLDRTTPFGLSARELLVEGCCRPLTDLDEVKGVSSIKWFLLPGGSLVDLEPGSCNTSGEPLLTRIFFLGGSSLLVGLKCPRLGLIDGCLPTA